MVEAFDGGAYQARFDQLAASGADVHGEATFVVDLGPSTVLDAGCGTGRVAIELARRGLEVTGVDVDASMLAEAQRRAPALEWIAADLTGLDLGRTWDVVVLAGNVPLFTPQGTEHALVTACAAHVAVGGALVAGFSLGRGYTIDAWDRSCAEAGLVPAGRWSTWDRRTFAPDDDYAVSLHRQP